VNTILSARVGDSPQKPVSSCRFCSILILLFLTLAFSVSLANPLFESTDELRHYRYVRHLVTQRSLPVQGAETVRSQSHHPPLYYALSALVSSSVISPHTQDYEHPINPFWGYRNWDVGVDNKLQYWHTPAENFPFQDGFLAAMLPRWVNVLLGALTVFLTYQLTLRIWSDSYLAWSAALLVALNPQFIYLSGAMNNDIIAAAAGTGVLLLCVVLLQSAPNFSTLIALGVVYGLALLSKLHLVALGLIIAPSVYLSIARNLVEPTFKKLIRFWLLAMAIIASLTLLLAGWWFWRNWQLYGDPTGLNMVNALWSGRPAQGNAWALWQGLPYLWATLWGRFGYGQIPLPSWIYMSLLIICILSLLGYLLPRRGPRPMALALLFTAIVIFTVIVAYYILIQPAGPMGRFLFPVLPAFAVILVGGLQRSVQNSRWVGGFWTLLMFPLMLISLWGYLWPAVSYPPRVTEPFPGQPVHLQFGDTARVLAVDIQPATVQPGEPIFVTVVWEPLQWTPIPYTVFIHLVDENGALISQRDTWPGLGRAPTTFWKGNWPFMDVYRVDLPTAAYAPAHITTYLGLYETTAGRLPALSGNGSLLGDSVVVGKVNLTPRSGPWPNNLYANFGNEIALVGYVLEPRQVCAGETFTLTLYWQPQPSLAHDYLVFAQAIGDDVQVWGSHDGSGPGWHTGALVTDVRHITLSPDTPAGSYPVQVGLFHAATGRLPVIAPAGWYHLDERVLLGPIKVQE